MRIAVIGAGNMGKALARLWIEVGHTVSLSFARDAEALAAFATSLGPNALVTTAEAGVSAADVVLLTVPYDAVGAAVAAIGGPHDTKPMITTVSPYTADLTAESVNLVSQIGEHSAAEDIASRLPDFHVVEAFNLTFADLLSIRPKPFENTPPTIPMCGDDLEAKRLASRLIADAGLLPIDVGALRVSRMLEPVATAWVQMAAASGLFPLGGLSIQHAPEPQSDFTPLNQGGLS